MTGIYHVQFVGGHSDGTELAVVGLNEKFYFLVFDQRLYKYGDWDTPIQTRKEVYRLLPGTTIYVFQSIGVEE